jgi:hypothetical protein
VGALKVIVFASGGRVMLDTEKVTNTMGHGGHVVGVWGLGVPLRSLFFDYCMTRLMPSLKMPELKLMSNPSLCPVNFKYVNNWDL